MATEETAFAELREGIGREMDALDRRLDEAGHDDDCILRCFAGAECLADHGCDACAADDQ